MKNLKGMADEITNLGHQGILRTLNLLPSSETKKTAGESGYGKGHTWGHRTGPTEQASFWRGAGAYQAPGGPHLTPGYTQSCLSFSLHHGAASLFCKP